MTDIEQVQANLGAMNIAIISLIDAHPDRQRLAQLIQKNSELSASLLLDLSVSDVVIDQTKTLLQKYLALASLP